MKLEDYPCTVLLADDEEDIRDVLRISLSDMGYKVYSAQNGEEALQIFQTVMPMIVITDIKMPGMDGIDLLKKIKRENPDTEVIMITGHGDMELAIKSLKYKAVDFITKPINVDALEISVSRAREKVIMKQKLQEYTENLERLIQEKTELQDHLSSLGLMIGSISHGIKGLLTGLDGGMYLLNTGFSTENSDRIREGWDIVRFMVERIRKMILDILFYAKKRELNWEQINAVGFADDVARVVEPKIKNHGIEFVREFEESVGEFEIDAGYIHAAMVNILDNAVDACLKDKSKDSHKIVFSVRQAETFILFDISDNGIGMKQETVEKLFKLFFSTKGSTGTGFGLFISNQIIQQHGGKISVKSSPNKGTTFTISIPKILPESAKADSQNI